MVYGRRRIGKTRLLVEWANALGGAYTVADRSTADLQRRYFAGAVAARLSGFGDVAYPDWRVLLARLAEQARAEKSRGPLVVDELPYLVATSPKLPSVLQHWVDHEARAARLTVAVAGSSQRMMQGLVLTGDAPLYGRATAVREVPFGEPERRSRRSLYRISDPFIRLWFRVVAPHRAVLAAAPRSARKRVLARYWRALVATAWEELCRAGVPWVPAKSGLHRQGPWGPASRWWRGNDPEWDLVSESLDGRRILLGEVKWSEAPLGTTEVRAIVRDALSRRPPKLGSKHAGKEIVHAVFVPRLRSGTRRTIDGATVVTGEDVLAASRRAG